MHMSQQGHGSKQGSEDRQPSSGAAPRFPSLLQNLGHQTEQAFKSHFGGRGHQVEEAVKSRIGGKGRDLLKAALHVPASILSPSGHKDGSASPAPNFFLDASNSGQGGDAHGKDRHQTDAQSHHSEDQDGGHRKGPDARHNRRDDGHNHYEEHSGQHSHHRTHAAGHHSSYGGHEQGHHADACTLAAQLGDVSVGSDAGRAPAVHGDYHWLRAANAYEDRQRRREAASLTVAACRAGNYSFAGRRCHLRRVAEMERGTRFLRAADVRPARGGKKTALEAHQCGHLLAVALQRARAGCRVAVVNAASAYHVGGGFNDGGRHALEESLNMQSTLFQSLAIAKQLALREGIRPPHHTHPQHQSNGRAWQCHIPVDGVVLSPNVEVFRGETGEGYPFLADPVELAAVVSLAMPNCNSHMHDAPCDRPPSDSEFRHLLQSKFMAVLGAASLAGANILVMPDAGCGVYGNSPEEVGRIFGEVVQNSFAGVFDEIHLVGKEHFAAAVKATCLC